MQSPARGVVSANFPTATAMSCLKLAKSRVGERLEENEMIFSATPAPSQLMMAWKNSARLACWCGVSSVARPVSRITISGLMPTDEDAFLED